jgi:hypothetical protein
MWQEEPDKEHAEPEEEPSELGEDAAKEHTQPDRPRHVARRQAEGEWLGHKNAARLAFSSGRV